jgi:hypothetical protein
MHRLSLIYFINQLLHVSGIFGHYQKVFTVCVQQLLRVTHLGEGQAVVQWLWHWATNWKVVGSIPDGVIGISH